LLHSTNTRGDEGEEAEDEDEDEEEVEENEKEDEAEDEADGDGELAVGETTPFVVIGGENNKEVEPDADERVSSSSLSYSSSEIPSICSTGMIGVPTVSRSLCLATGEFVQRIRKKSRYFR